MRLSLRWKIAGGFGIMLVLILLLGWVTLSLLGSLDRAQRRVFDEAVPGLRVIDEIIRSFTAQSAAIRGFLLLRQPEQFADYEREKAIAEASQRRLEELVRSPQQRGLLDELVESGRDFHVLVEGTVIPELERGRRGTAWQKLGGQGALIIRDIQNKGRQLRERQSSIVAQTEADLRVGSSQAGIILLGVIIATLAMGLALAIAMPRRLVADLGRLVVAARAVGRGDFDQKVEIRSSDEIQELADRFNEMQAGLKRLQQLALQDRELEIAASIQQNLLQRRLPETPEVTIVPMQRQANLVGGDWYDVDLAGKMLTVAVGDASGKGIGAALMATVTLSVLRSERVLGAGPRRIIERANQALRDVTEPDSFTTLIYATMDTGTGETTWLNMGHPAPYLLQIRDDGISGHFVEGPRNRALGWFEDPGLNENGLLLQPGDRLFLFTDGFLEAKSASGEIFGEERFESVLLRLAALEPDKLVAEVVTAVERFAAGKLDDDLTMLVVQFQGAALAGRAAQALTGEEAWHSRR